jgi:hypothetical protein
MMGSVLAMVGVSLVIVVMITAFLLVRRERRLSPEDRYRREIRALRTSAYLRSQPRPARQEGAHGLENQYLGGGW